MKVRSVTLRNTATVLAVSLTLCACVSAPEQAVETAGKQPTFIPVPVTMNALMNSVVAPPANTIWQYSYAGELSEENWQEILNASIQLATSATVVSLGGTNGADSERATTPEWQAWAEDMRTLALEAKSAAENQDQTALASAGDRLVDACALCHDVHLPGAAE